MRLVFHSLLCPMGSGGQLGLYSEYLAKQETGKGREEGEGRGREHGRRAREERGGG